MAIQVQPDYVYLDYAATAPLSQEAYDAMMPFMAPGRGNIPLGLNANSLHSPGRAAFNALELSRRSIAQDLGAQRPDEIIFTSGATEADNAALEGIACAALDGRQRKAKAPEHPVVITSMLEHEAVARAAAHLRTLGFEVKELAPDKAGFITLQALEAALSPDCVLVSIMFANSEIGSIQPIADLAALAHQHGALFHTDATQALGKVPINVAELGVDAASFSAHKVGGPKGVGALYLKSRTPFAAFLNGGGQEAGRRSGTQNVAGVAGFAAACHQAVTDLPQEKVRLIALRDELYHRLADMRGVRITVPAAAGSDRYLCNIVHIIVKGVESETMILRLDMEGFGVSGGSACSSHSLKPSHVLKAIGVSDDDAFSALRISLGRYTTQEDIDAFCVAFGNCVQRLRS